MMRKILESQQNMVVDFKKKLDSVYIELNGKFEFLNTYGKELNIQVQQINEVVKRLEKTPRQFFNIYWVRMNNNMKIRVETQN